MVEYYRQLDSYISSELDRLRATPFAGMNLDQQALRHLPADKSLTGLGLVLVDAERLAANFQAIIELLHHSAPDNPLAISLLQRVAAGDLHHLPWSAGLPQLEQAIGQWTDLDVESVEQLLHWAMSPFWRLAAEHYAAGLKDLVTNEKATCPICGQYPDFAVLDDREHGRRYLHCLCCNWQWPYKRIGCSYCGNEEHNQLGYTIIEDLKGYKIYHCEKCRSYLKTFDQRAATGRLDPNPLLEHVKTLFLDMLAIEKGYLPMHD